MTSDTSNPVRDGKKCQQMQDNFNTDNKRYYKLYNIQDKKQNSAFLRIKMSINKNT